MRRRTFIKNITITSTTLIITPNITHSKNLLKMDQKTSSPVVISTWSHGLPANKIAWDILKNKGKAIDAVEKGVRNAESDPECNSVGYGGWPDRDGIVSLDACIMDETGNCGAVSYLQNIKHPISVARKVMEETPHVMLSGNGALQFALSKGFKEENLLTEKSKKKWEEWLKKAKYEPIINIENHDTISMLALDSKNNLSGACTTSGLAWKLHGRVGDSPIIGAGLYVDNKIGGAAATGVGESVMKMLGSFLIVELMRNGSSPQKACEEAIERIISNQDYKNIQVGFLAINKNGDTGSFSVQKGFNYALSQKGETHLKNSQSYL